MSGRIYIYFSLGFTGQASDDIFNVYVSGCAVRTPAVMTASGGKADSGFLRNFSFILPVFSLNTAMCS